MPVLRLNMIGDGCWPDLQGKIGTPHVIHLGNGAPAIGLAVLEHGLESGLPSITIRIDLPDGRVVLAETTARLFIQAGRAIAARFPGLESQE